MDHELKLESKSKMTREPNFFSRSWLKPFVGALLSFSLVACAEIADEKKDGQDDAVQETAGEQTQIAPEARPSELLVDQILHIYQGELYTEEKLNYLRFVNRGQELDWTPRKVQWSFDKIILTAGGVLYTHGSDVDLTTKELISEGGHIETYPVGQKAALQTAGASGGVIQFHVMKATGEIEFNLRGENGGDGVKGAPAPREHHGNGIPWCDESDINGAAGTSGAPGGPSGVLVLDIADKSIFHLSLWLSPGVGGRGGDGGDGYGKAYGYPGAVKCDKRELGGFDWPMPSDGPKGADGALGEKRASHVIRNGERETFADSANIY